MAALRIMNSLSHMRSELLNPVRKKHTLELMEVAKILIWYEITHRTFMCNKRNDAYIDFQI